MFIVDEKRIATMRRNLGEASRLIKGDAYLPMFRNRQKNYKNEFEESVRIARDKRNAERYLASVWASKNVEKSLKWLRSILARAAAKAAEMRHKAKEHASELKYVRELNAAGRAKLERLYAKHICLKS